MEARLATSAWVGALIRRVHAAGDTAVVVAKGDATAGAVLLVHRRRNGLTTVWSAVPQATGQRAWRPTAEQNGDDLEKIEEYLARQRRYDPDLWIVELNIEELARFIDEPLLMS